MYDGHRVIVVTPAGRRRYMEILARYIGRALGGVVDSWHLWANTNDADDLEYIRHLMHHRSRRIYPFSDGDASRGIQNIRNFYPRACEPGTVYVRLDDDIVYLEDGFFTALVEFRLQEANALLVSASVVNNVLCDWLRQRSVGMVPESPRITYNAMCATGWGSGLWAEAVHRKFLETNHGWWTTTDWRLLDYERLSINAVSWRGEDMAEIVKAGGVGLDEESWLTQVYPRQTGRVNVICGSAVCAHFAFYPQRAYLDKTDILQKYRELSE